MKLIVAIGVGFWLLCGLVGARMMDDLDTAHWKTIARGPITLAQALREHPVNPTGPS
jgi:hypothetical protein